MKQMKDKFGEEKVEKWLKSGLVQTKPDRITGSTEPSDLEYLIPHRSTARKTATKRPPRPTPRRRIARWPI